MNVSAKAALQFNALVKQLTDVDPLLNCYTIAMLAALVFRYKFLKPRTLGIAPAYSYNRARTTQSLIAIKYLTFLQTDNGGVEDVNKRPERTALHACGELVIGGVPVDGVSKDGTTVYQVAGCMCKTFV